MIMRISKKNLVLSGGIAVAALISVFSAYILMRSSGDCSEKKESSYVIASIQTTANVIKKTLNGRQRVSTYLCLDDGTVGYVNLTEGKVTNVQLLDTGDKITYSLNEYGNIIIHDVQWKGDTGEVHLLSDGLRFSTITHSVRTGWNGKRIILRLEDGVCEYVDRLNSVKEALSLEKGDKITYSLNEYGNIVVHYIQWRD